MLNVWLVSKGIPSGCKWPESMGLLVIIIIAQNFTGLWVHKVSLSALFAVHRFIRAVFRFKIVVLRQLLDDDEALNLESRVRTAVHEGCHLLYDLKRLTGAGLCHLF
jgi:hypothetical protein